jgi:hypothetical protein
MSERKFGWLDWLELAAPLVLSGVAVTFFFLHLYNGQFDFKAAVLALLLANLGKVSLLLQKAEGL